MRFRRRRGDETSAGSDVDALSDAADDPAMRQPDTPEAATAAQRAVEAAEQLLERDSGLPNQRRLARALWRRVATFSMPAERDGVEQTALRCWAVCEGMLKSARGDAVAYDDVVGDVGMWAGVLVPALGSVGRHADAAKVYETSAIAAGRAYGARGRQARARLMLFPLAATADTMAQQRVRGPWNAASEEALDEAITSCHEVLGVLRGHLDDGPFEVTEVARTLQILSRLQIVAGRLQEAAAPLDEALALLATVADKGLRYAAVLGSFQAERDRLRGHLPNAAPATQPVAVEALPKVPRRAFERAARDAGLDPGELAPTEPGAVLAVNRKRVAASDDPARHGPAHGLLMAWQAGMLVETGKLNLARELADRSVRHLSSFGDRPQQIQAPLVVALAILKRAALSLGHPEQAVRAGQRAAILYDTLVARDPTYAEDLAETV